MSRSPRRRARASATSSAARSTATTWPRGARARASSWPTWPATPVTRMRIIALASGARRARRRPGGVAEAARVVLQRAAHDGPGLGGAVHLGDLRLAIPGGGHVLVAQKVVAHALDHPPRALAPVAHAAGPPA